MKWLAVATVMLSLCVARDAPGEEASWGHLQGGFVFDGELPRQERLPITKDREKLGESVPDESLLVHSENHGVANVLVYWLPPKKSRPPIHPRYDAVPGDVLFRVKGARYDPHIVLLRTNQQLVEQNDDEVGHCTLISVLRNTPSGILTPPHRPVKRKFRQEEIVPLPVRCCIHPWMTAYLLIRETPYMAKTDERGHFSIKHLPAGEHRFRLWHERIGYVREVQVGDSTSDSRGRLSVSIRAGKTTHLGDVKLAARLFVQEDKKQRRSKERR